MIRGTQAAKIFDNDTADVKDYLTINNNRDKMHSYRISKLREALEESQKKNWIYVGNAFRKPPLAPSQ